MDFEFIDEGDIEGVKRGRKTTVPAELVDLFKRIPKGKAVKLNEYAGDPSDPETYKTFKQNASSTIRKAGELAGLKVAIKWSPQGVPQVVAQSVKSPKSK